MTEEECGVWHPQEGVFNGHFKPENGQNQQNWSIATRCG
jgi:hypothetical protein